MSNGSKIELSREYLKSLLDGVRNRQEIKYNGKAEKSDVAMILEIEDICDVKVVGARASGNEFDLIVYNTVTKNTGVMAIPNYQKHKCTSNFAHSVCTLVAERLSQYKSNPNSIDDKVLREALSRVNDPQAYQKLNHAKNLLAEYARM